jgi:Type I phosphodiesterase / nucleotide pyrophosphatase
MKKRNLIFFVDALPFAVLSDPEVKSLLDEMAVYRPLAPSVGYSINIHQELFAGKAPDDVGYLGERSYIPLKQKLPLLFVRRMVSWLRRFFPRLDRYSRPIWNKILQFNTQFIPLDQLDKFSASIPYPLVKSEQSLFFDNVNWEAAIADRTGLTGKPADTQAFEMAKDAVLNTDKNIFVALLHIDALGHIYGNPSEEVKNASIEAIKMFKTLVKSLDSKGELGQAYLVSDHGMSNVTTVVDLSVEYKVPGFGDKWMCYYDSIYLKLWCDEEINEFKQIQNVLKDVPGHFLSKLERQELGVTDSSFGDHIFVLDEGAAFAPNFFGRGVAKGYHGYTNYGDTQLGVYISTDEREMPKVVSPLLVYNQMSKIF